MAPPSAERIAVIADGLRELGTALRVTAKLPHCGFGKFGHLKILRWK
jgi:hypothetical protein